MVIESSTSYIGYIVGGWRFAKLLNQSWQAARRCRPQHIIGWLLQAVAPLANETRSCQNMQHGKTGHGAETIPDERGRP